MIEAQVEPTRAHTLDDAAGLLSPDGATFVILSFEGPDPYSRAGGLGVRVSELSRSLAESGYQVHLVFVGDPSLPSEETREDGRLVLHRWCQWISAYHPDGVYAGEEGKWRDFTDSVPAFVLDRLAPAAFTAGHKLFILGEEWHTAEAMCRISDGLWTSGQRDQAVLLWNANNTMGFDRINWPRVNLATTITTVSRYMKHLLWSYGVDPLVIPNGIPRRLLGPVDDEAATTIRRSLGEGPTLLKVARWDPDKRWLLAIDTVAQLKATAPRARLIARGGVEEHGSEVLGHARELGLHVQDVALRDPDAASLAYAFSQADGADVLNVTTPLSPDSLRVLYRAADGVLANSGREPFGLVGLEAMAAGGMAFTGNTGEEYARHMENAVVLDTADPAEAAWYVSYLGDRPREQQRLRSGARQTARRFAWECVLEQLLARAQVLATGRR
jgi:glycosyltransferase involved in cell wall biosynthesis